MAAIRQARSDPPADPASAEDADDEALAALARLDPAAFAPLYRRYVSPIYRYCHRRLGSKEAAEDATARVFTQALAALPAYRDGSFRAWLFAIAHNAVANALRDARPHHPLNHAAAVRDPAPTPEAAALAAEDRLAVRAQLDMLSPDQRQVIELRLAGLTGPEIARALGKSHAAVKVAQFRAIARLRAHLHPPTEELPHDA
jgi:RNA polymerase sigma-70 factor (ECF subfamily)